MRDASGDAMRKVFDCNVSLRMAREAEADPAKFSVVASAKKDSGRSFREQQN